MSKVLSPAPNLHQSQAIIAMLAAGEKPTADELKKFKTVCKAVEIGTNGWKTKIEKLGPTHRFPSPRDAEVDNVLVDLENSKDAILLAMNCLGNSTSNSGGNFFRIYDAHIIECKLD